ncbi:hypothetical protein [Azospirillum rugosum]|uniref:LTXXQ motif family protein n=1 Tax=Azospirillum rugosum TaxID=416170 RepID=A0ABS4SV44_9PROT|nr:hypothetical protein [Azospirillum rugosum]MBP2296307.1 hypothetical protein [Azospirillum rugosum]MDQ0529828.1 hypothetical protein [Azospirillum rugosum]
MLHRSAALVAVLIALAPASAPAAERDPDWPCVQILVPTLSPGQIWSGDPIDGKAEDWRDIPGMEPVLKRILNRRADAEQEEEAIARFADGLGPDRNAALTALFAGAFDALNRDRSAAIAAIHRYAHQQRELLDSIDKALTRLQELPADAPEAAALKDDIAWRRRILDDRRRYQSALCDQPVKLEQKAGRIAREIAARLD